MVAIKQERRKHTRYPTKDGAYATISPGSTKIGQIVDISMIGLAFKYIDTSPDIKKRNNNSQTLFLSSMGYDVGDINFNTIADFELDDAEISDPTSDAMPIRMRRVEFTDLKLKQLFDLDYYIENNATRAKRPA